MPGTVSSSSAAGSRVPAVHTVEHEVRAGLEGQVQVLDHLGHIPDGADEARGQVVGVGGREADALDSFDLVDELEKLGQIRGGGQVASIGIDGLP